MFLFFASVLSISASSLGGTDNGALKHRPVHTHFCIQTCAGPTKANSSIVIELCTRTAQFAFFVNAINTIPIRRSTGQRWHHNVRVTCECRVPTTACSTQRLSYAIALLTCLRGTARHPAMHRRCKFLFVDLNMIGEQTPWEPTIS